ncbi:MAG TPA: NUDIX domain-containing protein [Jiangellaceae bacterium]
MLDEDAVFAEEWTRADDGVYERDSARVVIVDGDRRVLLMRASKGERSWWFTVGGGIGAGEDERTAAVREAYEETGLRFTPDDLIGPIARRLPTFDFLGRTCRQEEWLYLAKVPAATAVSTDGWTDVELVAMDTVAWWPLDELRRTDATIYPPNLGERVATILDHGWDGMTPMCE